MTLKKIRPLEQTLMNYHVVSAEYVSSDVVRLKFRDGTAGEIDLSAELTGPIFEPLRDLEYFRQFRVHPEFHTLVWPNRADLGACAAEGIYCESGRKSVRISPIFR